MVKTANQPATVDLETVEHKSRSLVRLTTVTCTNEQAVVITMPEDSQSVISRSNPHMPLEFNPNQKGVRQENLRVKGVVFNANVPAIPGTSLRGVLRDAIATSYLRDLHWKGQTFYSQSLNFKGGIKPTGKERLAERVIVREVNPLLSVFGACDPGFIAGRLNVGYMFLKNDPENLDFQLQKFSVQRGVANERNLLLEQHEQDAGEGDAKKAFRAREKETEDKIKEFRAEMRGAKGADKDAIKEQIAAETRDFNEFKETHREEHGTEVELRYITPAHEITLGIPAHREFENMLVLEDATNEEIGLFLSGMLEVSSRQVKVGGFGARGAGGFFNLVYKIEFYDPESRSYVEDGTTLDPGPRSLDCIATYMVGVEENRYVFDVKSVLTDAA